jgi:hypothetical protein
MISTIFSDNSKLIPETHQHSENEFSEQQLSEAKTFSSLLINLEPKAKHKAIKFSLLDHYCSADFPKGPEEEEEGRKVGAPRGEQVQRRLSGAQLK